MYGDGEGITVFAGGTILLPEIASGRLAPERALMLHRTGLDELRVDGDRVVIGAMVSVAALADGPDELLAGCRTPRRRRRGAPQRDGRREHQRAAGRRLRSAATWAAR